MKKTKKFLTGFTLIELLVVIAIIGILASIVLVSFPSATKKANDSRVEAAMSQMRVLMTSYQSTNGSYTGFSCTAPTDMVNLCADVAAKDYDKTYPGTTMLKIAADGSAMCTFARLNAKDGATWYCVDSAGKAGVTANSPATSDCNDSSFVCPSDTAL